MVSMDTESSFETPAGKMRKALESTTPTSYKNRTLLIVKGIDPKYNTQLRIMSELRQYHPSLLMMYHCKHFGLDSLSRDINNNWHI